MTNLINRALAAEKKLFILLAVAVAAAGGMRAEEHSYVWNAEFPNYKQQIPSSDFTTADGMFRFTAVQ